MEVTAVLDALKTALDGTGYKFRHYGWSRGPKGVPKGDYGVYAEDGANDLEADDAHAEKAIEGTVDYFTRDDSGAPQTTIETALESVEGLSWYLNSIQFEQDTGYIHYEWIFQLTEDPPAPEPTPDPDPEPTPDPDPEPMPDPEPEGGTP